jgi:hypothetical protein
MVKYLNFHNSSLCLKILFNVNGWQGHSVTHPLVSFIFLCKSKELGYPLENTGTKLVGILAQIFVMYLIAFPRMILLATHSQADVIIDLYTLPYTSRVRNLRAPPPVLSMLLWIIKLNV